MPKHGKTEGKRTESVRKQAMLDELASTPKDAAGAAKRAGIHVKTHDKWLATSPKYRGQVREIAKANEMTIQDIIDFRFRARLQDIRDGVVKDRRTKSMKRADMLWALRKKLAIVSTAAELACVTMIEHRAWKRDVQQYKQAVDDLKEWKKDVAEEQLLMQIIDGSVQAQRVFLEANAPERGYGKADAATNDEEKITKLTIDWGKA